MTADEIIPKLSPTRTKALRHVAGGLHHEVHGRELGGLEAWGLIGTSRVHGQKRPTSVWLTDLGKQVLSRLGDDT